MKENNVECYLTIDGIRSGDEQAYKILFDTYYESLLRYAISFVHDISKAKDIVQDAFISIWRNRQRLESVFHVRNSLYLAVKHFSYSLTERTRDKRDVLRGYTYIAEYLSNDIERRFHYKNVLTSIMQALKQMPNSHQILISKALRGERIGTCGADYIRLCRTRKTLRPLIIPY